MPGFSYGGKGDGTNWSSEKGNGTEPGGGSKGTGGKNSSDNSGDSKSATQNQAKEFMRIPSVRKLISNFYNKAIDINNKTEIYAIMISLDGVITVTVKGLTSKQAESIGLSGVIIGYQDNGVNSCIGDLKTDKSLTLVGGVKALSGKDSLRNIFLGSTKTGDWHEMTDAEIKNKADEIAKNAENEATKTPSLPVYTQGIVIPSFKDKISSLKDGVSLAASINKDISIKVGEKYSKIAQNLENELKSKTRGKTIRSAADAEKTFNRIIAGANKKISVKDKAAVVTWLKKIDAEQLTRNAKVLGKAFTGIDWAIKALNLKDAAIKGVEKGDWSPFRNEIEAMVLSAGVGYALAASLAFFSPFALTSLPAIFAFAYIVGYITSKIDAAEAAKLEGYISKL